VRQAQGFESGVGELDAAMQVEVCGTRYDEKQQRLGKKYNVSLSPSHPSRAYHATPPSFFSSVPTTAELSRLPIVALSLYFLRPSHPFLTLPSG